MCDSKEPDDHQHWVNCREMEEVWKEEWIPCVARCLIQRNARKTPREAWSLARKMFTEVEPWTNRCGLRKSAELMEGLGGGTKDTEAPLRVEMIEAAARVWNIRMSMMSKR